MKGIAIAYRVMFDRRNKINKEEKTDKASVVIQAYKNPDRRYFKTGVKLTESEWDAKRNQAKNPSVNVQIGRQMAALREFEIRFPSIHNRDFTLRDFDLMDSEVIAVKPQKQILFTTFMIEEIEKNKSKLSYRTNARYKLAVANLIAFNDGQPVRFVDFSYEFVQNYDRYLRDKRQYHQNSIVNEHKALKLYFRLAVNMEYVRAAKNPYLSFKLKKQATNKDVLYEEEIGRIQSLTFTAEQKHLELCRDAFLFSIYTLLRISDVTQIRADNITKTDEGILLEITAKKTIKTNPKHTLPLYKLHSTSGGPSLPELIIEKYARDDNQPFFNRSHAKLNEHIKTIVKMAKITKKVTFHTARHTGITWLVMLGLEVPHVQGWAQHSTIATTMQYIKLSKAVMDERLSSINWPKTK